jgi:hypothetical protein
MPKPKNRKAAPPNLGLEFTSFGFIDAAPLAAVEVSVNGGQVDGLRSAQLRGAGRVSRGCSTAGARELGLKGRAPAPLPRRHNLKVIGGPRKPYGKIMGRECIAIASSNDSGSVSSIWTSTSMITKTVWPQAVGSRTGSEMATQCVRIYRWITRLPGNGLHHRQVTESSPRDGIVENINDPFCPRVRFYEQGGRHAGGKKCLLKNMGTTMNQSAFGAAIIVRKKTEKGKEFARSLFANSGTRSQKHRKTIRAVSRNTSSKNVPRSVKAEIHFSSAGKNSRKNLKTNSNIN